MRNDGLANPAPGGRRSCAHYYAFHLRIRTEKVDSFKNLQKSSHEAGNGWMGAISGGDGRGIAQTTSRAVADGGTSNADCRLRSLTTDYTN